jgi:secreted trypsin-like serine protease
MVCVGNQTDGGVGSCFGDAGGSLVVPDGSSEDLAVLYGLVSWGSSFCAEPRGPGVFTRITPFVGWIRGYMKGMTI